MEVVLGCRLFDTIGIGSIVAVDVSEPCIEC